jgi:hypothetical protein
MLVKMRYRSGLSLIDSLTSCSYNKVDNMTVDLLKYPGNHFEPGSDLIFFHL